MIFLSILILSTTACLYKPFEHSPPDYKLWIKKNVGEEGVKIAMRDCGFKNLRGWGYPRDTDENFDRAEKCMVKNGFHYYDGYQGFCKMNGIEKIAGCYAPS
jgi:hypothetical protein